MRPVPEVVATTRVLTVVATIAVSLGAPFLTTAGAMGIVAIQSIAGIALLGRKVGRERNVGAASIGIGLGMGLSTISDVALHATRLGRWAWCLPALLAVPILVRRAQLRDQSDGTPATSTADLLVLGGAVLLSMMHDYYWTGPFGVGVVAIGVVLERRGSARRDDEPSSTLRMSRLAVPFVIGLVVLLVAIARWSGPHAPWMLQPKDFVFFRALAWSIDRYGITENPLLAGTPLHYHWLSYGWVGMVGRLLGGETWLVLTVLGPALVCTLLLAAVWGWISRVASRRAAIAAVLLVALVDTPRLWSAGVHTARLESFSTILGTVFLLAIPYVLSASQVAERPMALATLLGVLAFATKLSHGAAAAAGLLLVELSRGGNRRALAGRVGALAGSFGGTAVLVFGIGVSERGDSLAIGPLSFAWLARPEFRIFPIWQYLPVALVVSAAFCAIPVLAAIHGSIPTMRGRRDARFVVGASLAGLVLYLGTARVEASQGFFLHAALCVSIPFVSAGITSARFVPAGRANLTVLAAVSAILATMLTLLDPARADGGRVAILLRGIPLTAPLLAPLLGLAAAAMLHRRTSSGGRERLRRISIAILAASVGVGIGNWWVDSPEYRRERGALAAQPIAGLAVDQLRLTLDDLAPTDAVIATSHSLCDGKLCTGEEWIRSITTACDLSPALIGSGECFLSYDPPLAGVVERRFWVDGFSFLSPGRPTPTDLLRARLSLEFAQRPGAASVAPLREAGIRWFIVDKDLPHADDYGSVGTVRYENERFIVLELFDA